MATLFTIHEFAADAEKNGVMLLPDTITHAASGRLFDHHTTKFRGPADKALTGIGRLLMHRPDKPLAEASTLGAELPETSDDHRIRALCKLINQSLVPRSRRNLQESFASTVGFVSACDMAEYYFSAAHQLLKTYSSLGGLALPNSGKPMAIRLILGKKNNPLILQKGGHGPEGYIQSAVALEKIKIDGIVYPRSSLLAVYTKSLEQQEVPVGEVELVGSDDVRSISFLRLLDFDKKTAGSFADAARKAIPIARARQLAAR